LSTSPISAVIAARAFGVNSVSGMSRIDAASAMARGLVAESAVRV